MFIVALVLLVLLLVMVIVELLSLVLVLTLEGGLHSPTSLRKISDHAARARTIVVEAVISALTMQI
jgi:hypothetical protein